jgi:hypothetical protein
MGAVLARDRTCGCFFLARDGQYWWQWDGDWWVWAPIDGEYGSWGSECCWQREWYVDDRYVGDDPCAWMQWFRWKLEGEERRAKVILLQRALPLDVCKHIVLSY